MQAILITNKNDDYQAQLTEVDEGQLPTGDVTVKVDYSTINFKDSLAITGKSPVVRQFPMVPGVDLAGVVESSLNPEFAVGERVMVNGFGLGELHWGGLAQEASVQSDWLTPIPSELTSKQAMAIGTAGYTAMLCVLALEQHNVTPEQGEILVTGAAGGVGSVAIALLAKLGFSVVASTGRIEEADYLHRLGAVEIMGRAQLGVKGKPLGKERWAGVIDTVGSHTLANACATSKSDGVVAACGLAQGFDFPATVMPFILRGITLVGINSVYRSKANRMLAWQRLVRDLDLTLLATMTTEISLPQAIEVAQEHMQSNLLGRYVVNVNA